MSKKKKDLEVVDLTTMEYPTSDIVKIEEVPEENEEIIEVEDTQIKELMEEEIELQKKENEEKQQEVKILENSEEIYGELEG